MNASLVEMAANGRLVIPHETRRSLGVQGPMHYQVSVENGSIVLTPVAIVPVDGGFPIDDELVSSAGRAAAEVGPGVSRAALRAKRSRRRPA